jgi:DNA polymerase-3 subunit delta'
MARARAPEDGEAAPEADRLEGFPHPRETPALFGQEAAEIALTQAFAGGRMHHAWLLTGREGIGKATLAYRLARYALARPEQRQAGTSLAIAAQTSAARQVAALSHPGLLVLRRPYDGRNKRLGTAIPVDEVRRLKSFLGLTGGQHEWRIVIVDSADELNVNAANALLKSLEEPPRRALFLLICAEPGRLLATIRSRCRRLELAPLAGEDLKQAMAVALRAVGRDLPSPEEWRRLEVLAEGSVRRGLQLAESGGLQLSERIEAIFAALPKVDWLAAHALADQLTSATQEQRFEAFFDLFLDYLARLVRAGATGEADAPLRAVAERLMAPQGFAGRLPVWAGLWQEVLRERTAAARLNLDRRALLLGVLARLEALAGG